MNSVSIDSIRGIAYLSIRTTKGQYLIGSLSDGPMDIGRWIHYPSILINFEMYLWASRSARSSYQGYILTFLDNIAKVNQKFFGVCVSGGVPCAMVYLNHQPKETHRNETLYPPIEYNGSGIIVTLNNKNRFHY